MKYESFKKLRIVGIIGVIGAAIFGISQCSSKKRTDPYAGRMPAPAAGQQGAPSTATGQPYRQQASARPDYGAQTLPLSPTDRQIIDHQKSGTATGKQDENGLKQTVVMGGMKLDMRSDTKKGYSYWNRIKVDYNQNRAWDEKWSFGKDGKIRREVSPSDNEDYTIRYTLQGDHWEKQ